MGTRSLLHAFSLARVLCRSMHAGARPGCQFCQAAGGLPSIGASGRLAAIHAPRGQARPSGVRLSGRLAPFALSPTGKAARAGGAAAAHSYAQLGRV